MAVADDAIVEAIALLARTTGVFAEPAAAAALAGLRAALDDQELFAVELLDGDEVTRQQLVLGVVLSEAGQGLVGEVDHVCLLERSLAAALAPPPGVVTQATARGLGARRLNRWAVGTPQAVEPGPVAARAESTAAMA